MKEKSDLSQLTVDFIAGSDAGYGSYGTEGNVAMMVYCGSPLWWAADYMPLSTGKITVSECTFIDGLCGPDFWSFDENSVCRITNNTIGGGFQQIFLGCMAGSKVYVSGNTCHKSTYCDLYILAGDQGYYEGLSPSFGTKYTVSGNRFQTPAEMVSIFLYDEFRMTYGDPLEATISGNFFENGDDGVAIQSFNVKNSVIRNNKFTGTGSTGVWLDGDEASGTFSEGNQLTGNNFLEAAYTDAAVYLGPVTRNNKVVGMPGDLVVDEGTNNKIIGTKAQKHGVPPLRPLFKGMKPLK